jgi:hypothetical protein
MRERPNQFDEPPKRDIPPAQLPDIRHPRPATARQIDANHRHFNQLKNPPKRVTGLHYQ